MTTKNEDVWTTMPKDLPSSIPPGLECLASIDELQSKRQVTSPADVANVQRNNMLALSDNTGQPLYYASENSSGFLMNRIVPTFPFGITIFEPAMQPVIHFELTTPMASCCRRTLRMEVSSPPGTTIGYVEYEKSFLAFSLAIKNASDDKVLRIKGPSCFDCTCRDPNLKILSLDGSQIGNISSVDGVFTGIIFPKDLDVRMKALLLGACFFMNFVTMLQTLSRFRRSSFSSS